jgi:L-alanine-DL-glutamate epimerase-like enolase superfamily enzyme
MHDEPADMLRTLEKLRDRIEAGLTREELRGLLPSGGARNAVDCALWELEARWPACLPGNSLASRNPSDC